MTIRLIKRTGWICMFLLAALMPCFGKGYGDAAISKNTVCIFLDPSAHFKYLEPNNDLFPVERIIKDLHGIGITDVFFVDQAGRGGSFYHKTTVPNAGIRSMRGRDYLKELLGETEKYGINVWLMWTPPQGKYPGTDILGLNHPGMIHGYASDMEKGVPVKQYSVKPKDDELKLLINTVKWLGGNKNAK